MSIALPPVLKWQGSRRGPRQRQIAADLNISDQTIYGWRRQELIDTGQLPGLNRAELSAANRRIRKLETEVVIPRKGP